MERSLPGKGQEMEAAPSGIPETLQAGAQRRAQRLHAKIYARVSKEEKGERANPKTA